MTYELLGIAAYLVVGVFLTKSVFAAPTMRTRFKDLALGAIFMPIICVAAMLCVFFEKMWKRLLIVLDFDPPEEMRAGPEAPRADSPDT